MTTSELVLGTATGVQLAAVAQSPLPALKRAWTPPPMISISVALSVTLVVVTITL